MARDDMTRHGGEHKDGVRTGYETDGTHFWLAPKLVESFGEIQDRERALQKMIAAYNEAIEMQWQAVEKDYRRWWDNVYDDLSLDPTIAYAMNRLAGRLEAAGRLVVKKPPEPEEDQGSQEER